MKSHPLLTSILSLTALALPANAFDFTFLSATNPTPNNAAEILTYTPDGFRVGATFSDNVNIDPALHRYGAVTYQMNVAGTLVNETIIDFQATFPLANVTSTAFDPVQRGFGVVAMFPTADQDAVGKVGFFNYRTGEILGTVDVGFHPDSVTFSADGSKLVVVNEGERPLDFGTSGKSTSGSLSVFDLSAVPDVNSVPAGFFGGLHSFTRDFAGVDLSQTRMAPDGASPLSHAPEPEFAAIVGDTVYVTLQEANAVGIFNIASDITQSSWTAVRGLGTITQIIDASNADGAGGTPVAAVNDVVRGLPMPDNIVTYVSNGVLYYVTTNEGDARQDNSDIGTVTTLKGEGKLDPSISAGSGDVSGPDALGPLNVSRLDGDTDGDGDIDIPTMLGTRSFTIWRASDGVMIYDSGSLENILLALDPTTHNINRSLTTRDGRSPQKGPEPEAISIGNFDGKTYAVIALERQNGLLAFDISNPNAVVFDGDYFNALTDPNPANNFLLSPESVVFVAASDNPTGLPLFLVGHEGTGLANGTDGILVLSAQVPEPNVAALIAGGWGLVFGARRRRALR